MVHRTPDSRYLWSGIFLGIVCLSLFSSHWFDTAITTEMIGEHSILSFFVVTILMLVATVIAPITVLPLIPLLSPTLGPLITTFACWIGWTAGSVVAFLLARHGGRPLLKRFVSLEEVLAYEKYIPPHAQFPLIFALRIVMPVDVLSYALGILSTVSLRVYASASALGILWFSVAFSYLGSAFAEHNTVLFLVYSVLSAIIFVGALWYVRTSIRK